MIFLTTLVLQTMKFGKIKNIELPWNLGKIKKYWAVLKICLKFEILDHPLPGNNEIWQNQEILSCVENLAQIWVFWWPLVLWTNKFGKIKKFWVTLIIEPKFEIYDHPQPPRSCKQWNLAQSMNFESLFKLTSNLRFLPTPGLANDEIWQNQEILSHFQKWAQIWDFWPIRSCECWNLAKSENFKSHLKFGPNFRFLTTFVLWTMMKLAKSEDF